MTKKQYEQIGWLGFCLIVSAYLLLTLKFFAANSASYHLLNLAGALCMVANAKHNKALPLFWLNVVWALIAILGLMKIG
ncbi:MAG: hypothetical protein NTV43_06275 [Methylococcales bacterium]|nr:hypothetical protein [Methylococcales bacterium]